MKRSTILVAALSMIVSVAIAQVPPDEAMRRLKEKHQAKEIAATQPSILTGAEVEAMRKELVQLRVEVADLKKENDYLRHKVSTADAAVNAPKLERDGNGMARIKKGMTYDEVIKLRGAPRRLAIDSDGNKTATWERGSQPIFQGGQLATRGGVIATYTVIFKNGVVDSFEADGSGVE